MFDRARDGVEGDVGAGLADRAGKAFIGNVPGIVVGAIVPVIDPIAAIFPWPPPGQNR